MNFYKQQLCLLAFLILMIGKVSAQLSIPSVFSSNMVLQREQKVPVWGKAKPKETIQIHFGKQHLKTKADVNGKWQVELLPMNGEKNAKQLIVKGKDSTIVFENVVVGEVWLCSGQSNMEYRMKLIPQFATPVKGEDLAALELKKPANPMIRVFNCQRDTTKNANWKVADAESLENTSAAGYFFGKALMEKLDVPVGIITSAIGGTRIEAWTTTSAYEASDIFVPQLKKHDGKIDGFRPGNWYKTMIAPIIPYAIKGFLWYQGENNCGIRDKQYAEKMQVLVQSWRKTFRTTDAPFYYVLLAPHIYSDRLHKGSYAPLTAADLPAFWMQQIKALTLIPNSGFVSVSDLVDNIRDIHPSYKWEVGARLARLALAKTYGFNEIVCSGPQRTKSEAVADSVVVSFSNVAGGLKTNDKRRLLWFEIAREDGIFYPALAEIRGTDKVVVWHPEITKPVKVRFCWHETAISNLVNSEGLPATPFNCN